MEGNRIRRSFDRIERDLIQRYLPLPVANVSDVMSRMTAGGARLRPMHRGGKLCGPALTVKSRPGDNLMLHKALDLAEPGDVIVCDAGGDTTNALMGELMLAHAIRRGIGGFVLYGAIRDLDAFQSRNLPVYALGVTHRGPYKDGPGEIGFPVSLDGMVVAPGDLMLGDADGVLAVPRAEAGDILSRARKKQEAEERQMAATEAGAVDRSWVDRALAEKACVLLD